MLLLPSTKPRPESRQWSETMAIVPQTQQGLPGWELAQLPAPWDADLHPVSSLLCCQHNRFTLRAQDECC